MKPTKLTSEKTAALCRGLALLLQAGLPLADSAFLLCREETGCAQAVLQTMGTALDEGKPLFTAMEESGGFPAYVPGLVRVGEETGHLQEALEALAEYYEEQVRIAAQLRRTLVWPCLMLTMMLVVMGVLLVKVLPVFDGVYASLGSGLTGAAAGLLQLGQWIEKLLPLLAALLTAIAAFVAVLAASPKLQKLVFGRISRRFGDRWLLRRFNNARYARALAMALGSGLPLEQGMELARNLLSDIPGAADRMARCAGALKSGADLAQAMEQAQLLSPSDSRLLAAGFHSGSADRVMDHMAGRMMEDAVHRLEDWAARVEPALVLVTSALVGLVLLSAMLPLVNILSSLG